MSKVTLEELSSFLNTIRGVTQDPGGGVINVHPDYEQYMPQESDLIFSERTVVDRETIRYVWMRV